MPKLQRITELFDETKEVMSWAVFLVACGALAFKGLDGWTVALFGMSLVTNGVVRIKSAGPAGVEFHDQK